MTTQSRRFIADSTIFLLLILVVLLSFSFFAFAQSKKTGDLKPWEAPMPAEIEQVADEKPMGAIKIETSCATKDGEKLRHSDPGYSECLVEKNNQLNVKKNYQKKIQ